MTLEVTRKAWTELPAWVSREVVRRFTGLDDRGVTALVKAGRLRTLPVGATGRRVRYHKLDLGELCGFAAV